MLVKILFCSLQSFYFSSASNTPLSPHFTLTVIFLHKPKAATQALLTPQGTGLSGSGVRSRWNFHTAGLGCGEAGPCLQRLRGCWAAAACEAAQAPPVGGFTWSSAFLQACGLSHPQRQHTEKHPWCNPAHVNRFMKPEGECVNSQSNASERNMNQKLSDSKRVCPLSLEPDGKSNHSHALFSQVLKWPLPA